MTIKVTFARSVGHYIPVNGKIHNPNWEKIQKQADKYWQGRKRPSVFDIKETADYPPGFDHRIDQ